MVFERSFFATSAVRLHFKEQAVHPGHHDPRSFGDSRFAMGARPPPGAIDLNQAVRIELGYGRAPTAHEMVHPNRLSREPSPLHCRHGQEEEERERRIQAENCGSS